MGMAAGGMFGTGLGRGRPDLTYLAESDFIIPSFGEELGLVGLFAILVLYALLVERGLRTSLGTRDGFGKLLAAGLSFSARPAVLRRRRRRHPGHPAHRPDRALPVLRRLLAAGQLVARRRAAADLRPRPPPAARARPPRSAVGEARTEVVRLP